MVVVQMGKSLMTVGLMRKMTVERQIQCSFAQNKRLYGSVLLPEK